MTQAPPLDWIDGAPRSRVFDDVYFSAEDGLAESRSVFLKGAGLPERWAGRRHFTVAELGFGTGLNILALLDLWRQTRPEAGRLHIFSVEAFPLSQDDAVRALAAWPELAGLADGLAKAWPSRRPGFHRVDFPGLGATLDLFIGEAAAGLAAWEGRADAWFLDGFAPSRNPQMWSEDLMALVAARSAPGAVAATFTVAGLVRRGLAAAGFAVEKRPGFGRKKERLEAILPGETSETGQAGTPRVAIIGAGIAGAALARAFRAQGIEPRVLDADGLGAGASGNPSALVTPRLDAGGGAAARLHAQAFERALDLYEREAPSAILARGAVQLEAGERDASRFDRIVAWEGFAAGELQRLDAHAVAAALDEETAAGGLLLPRALTLQPARVLEAWTGPVERVRLADLADLDADIICLAAGPFSNQLAPLGPLRAVRGQVSTSASPFSGLGAAWGGYAICAPGGGALIGATHDRDAWETDAWPEDDARNRVSAAKGRPALEARLANLEGRASLRAATPDHLPLAGRIGAGLFVLTGLGGRGFTLAPLLAEQVAAQALGLAQPLPADLAKIVDPGRYAGRTD